MTLATPVNHDDSAACIPGDAKGDVPKHLSSTAKALESKNDQVAFSRITIDLFSDVIAWQHNYLGIIAHFLPCES